MMTFSAKLRLLLVNGAKIVSHYDYKDDSHYWGKKKSYSYGKADSHYGFSYHYLLAIALNVLGYNKLNCLYLTQITAIVNETRGSTALDFVFKTGMIFWTDALDKCIYKWVNPDLSVLSSSFSKPMVECAPDITRYCLM